MALAQIAEIQRLKLVQRSARLGTVLLRELHRVTNDVSQRGRRPRAMARTHVRGLGLMAGVELRRPDGSPATGESIQIIKRMLHRGFILLPEGEHGNVISFTPPLTITEPRINRTIGILGEELTTDNER